MALSISVAPANQGVLPTQQSFSQKLLTFTLTLTPSPSNPSGVFQGTGVPGADGTNQVVLSGSRASARIQNNGSPSGSNADVAIYGLAPSLVNQITTLGMTFPTTVNRNLLTISAGDAVVGLSPIFTGTIIRSLADYAAHVRGAR